VYHDNQQQMKLKHKLEGNGAKGHRSTRAALAPAGGDVEMPVNYVMFYMFNVA
jgi:hypothetical protein